MNKVIKSNSEKLTDYIGASIYLDACFIITYLDKDDQRRADVINLIAEWAEQSDILLCISNHTIIEVVNRFFHSLILGAIDSYYVNNHLINQTPKGYEKVSERDKERMVDFNAASFIYKVAKRTDLLNIYNNRKASANVNELIKAAKTDFAQEIDKLEVFYQKAIEMFQDFYIRINEELELPIIILPSTSDDYLWFEKFMKVNYLEPTDAMHLAIAHSNNCHYFATLDNDFNNLYSIQIKLKILNVS